MKHTPGPWELAVSFPIPTVKGNGESIARIMWISVYPEQQAANARLIAAAPELLELLIKLRQCDRDQHGHDRDLWGINAEIDAAITKATGEDTP